MDFIGIEGPEKQDLLQELIMRLGPIYWPLKLVGFGRFDINRGQITRTSLSSIILTLFVLAVVHFCTYYIVYALSFKINYLFITENLILFNFLGFHTLVLGNVIINRSPATQFLNTSVNLDVFLGPKETMFMRELFSKIYFILTLCVVVNNLVILVFLFFTYQVDLSVYLAGTFLFTLLYFIYYDLSFFLSLYSTLTLRVRYLNVAIMKLAEVNLEYLPKQHPFNSFLWEDEFNNKVDFHLRAEKDKYYKAFVMIFKQLRYLENMYRCTILGCLTYLTVGTFIMVQSWIIWAKSTDVEVLRTLNITGWCLLSWIFQIAVSLQTDMFQRQINQTTLICTFIQLKPTYSDEIYELTASIIRMMEVRDPRISIYDLFYFDTGLLLRIASSIFVYITMQLQIAFPRTPDAINTTNGTERL